MSTFRQQTIPDWVNWLAQDADGCWWGFEVEPNPSHQGWYENELGRYIKLQRDRPNPDWETSLQPAKPA
ncbi:MAG: hypothetical protein P8Z75_10675 [Gammaproteobacteria bacterium]|jgi:hypothetical protein